MGNTLSTQRRQVCADFVPVGGLYPFLTLLLLPAAYPIRVLIRFSDQVVSDAEAITALDCTRCFEIVLIYRSVI
ncbi:MAG: hypothetical protein MUC83_00115, partial [Pirellula sp.]|nr:hypothetical protein [Pirellula sp.]